MIPCIKFEIDTVKEMYEEMKEFNNAIKQFINQI